MQKEWLVKLTDVDEMDTLTSLIRKRYSLNLLVTGNLLWTFLCKKKLDVGLGLGRQV